MLSPAATPNKHLTMSFSICTGRLSQYAPWHSGVHSDEKQNVPSPSPWGCAGFWTISKYNSIIWEGSGKWLCSAGVQKYIFSKGADAWKETIQASTWHHNQSYYCIWKQLSSSQIYKLLGFGTTCIYCTCKCLNILHFHISMYFFFLKQQDTTDHKQWWTNYYPGHNKPWQFMWHREFPKTHFNFQPLRPVIYI